MANELDRGNAQNVAQAATIFNDRRVTDDPLLVSYGAKDLHEREIAQLQTQELRRAAFIALERKAIADSLRDNFRLTGSDLPADADPRQLHLF